MGRDSDRSWDRGISYSVSSPKMGCKTLQLDQFILPHGRGSSHGHSRITRKAYPEPYYARMMLEAYDIWKELEDKTKTQLYRRSGCVLIDKTGSSEISGVVNALSSINSRAIELDPAGLRNRYPTMQFDSTYSGVIDPDGGVLAADKCLTVFQTEFVRLGGRLQDGETVTSIIPSHSRVAVVTNKDSYSANSIVIASGAWTNKLTDPLGLHLPLVAQRVKVWYWKALQKGFDITEGFPAFIVPDVGQDGIWGVPAFEYPGLVKIAYHAGPSIDPDQRDLVSSTNNNEAELKYATDFIRAHFRGLEPTPSITETCMYTSTPDRHFILDRHPKWKNVIIGAGFSGHGFKLAPVVGKVLAELASFKQPSYCLDPFTISRFHAPEAKL